MFHICCNRSNKSCSVHKILDFKPPTCISYPNRRFFSCLFIQKLYISGIGEGSERSGINFHLYRKESVHKFLPGEVQAVSLFGFKGWQRGQDKTPLGISAKLLAKHKKLLAIQLHSSLILAVLLHHLKAGDTDKRREMPHSKICISGNFFLEGNLSGDFLLVGLLPKNVLGIMDKMSLRMR